jgi:hypothetical protein
MGALVKVEHKGDGVMVFHNASEFRARVEYGMNREARNVLPGETVELMSPLQVNYGPFVAPVAVEAQPVIMIDNVWKNQEATQEAIQAGWDAMMEAADGAPPSPKHFLFGVIGFFRSAGETSGTTGDKRLSVVPFTPEQDED